jgi:mRNA interferase MazF
MDYNKETLTRLSEALRIAIGNRSVEQFAQMVFAEPKVIASILYTKGTIPDRELCRRIAARSEGRITHTYLYELCGYSEKDTEENRDWAVWKKFKRGQIYYVDLGYNLDYEQCGVRPCVVIQNDVGNQKGGIVQIAPLTSKTKNNLPTHVYLSAGQGLTKDSIIMVEQARCISKRRFFYNGFPSKITELNEAKLKELNNAILFEFGIEDLDFSDEVAYKMLIQIYKMKKKNDKDLVDVMQDKIAQFVDYCTRYHKDANEIKLQFIASRRISIA